MADWKHGLRRVLYPAYEARVLRRMPRDRLPKHVGVMLDGNRRWARAVGRDTAPGHPAGAAHIAPLLGWCDEVGIKVVT
ncbi:MAG: undecaprenyl diphosphate synthase family protein, partial [Nocardioides sp.]|nr:undecaprenyl diphosphate synthase family protein [Nocardioides sp.]